MTIVSCCVSDGEEEEEEAADVALAPSTMTMGVAGSVEFASLMFLTLL